MDQYPDNWKEIADRIKKAAGNKCERCGRVHDPQSGYTLTVHHLVPIKSLVEDWNLAALCQRCHLHIQGVVNMFQDYMLPHSKWFIPHLEGFNEWRKNEQRKKLKIRRRNRCRELRSQGLYIQPKWPNRWKKKPK